MKRNLLIFLITILTISACKPTDVFFGDSITLGNTGVNNQGSRWTTLYTQDKGTIEFNLAISGSCLQNSKPVNPAGALNMFDRINEIPKYGFRYGKLFISYGTNDVGFNLPNYTPDNYKTQLVEVIQVALNRDWPTSKIIVSSPYYFEQKGRDNYTGNYGVETASDSLRHISFVEATKLACDKTGVVFANTYQHMKLNGGSTLLSKDGLHPNDKGHKIIADYMKDF